MRYQRKHYYITSVIIAMIIFILFMGFGYANLSNLLRISGTSNIKPVGNKLPVQIIKMDVPNDRYILGTPNNFGFDYETLIDNELWVYYRAANNGNKPSDNTLKFKLKNLSNNNMIGGTASVAITGSSYNLKDASISLDKLSLIPNEAVTGTINFFSNTHQLVQSSMRITIAYTISNVTKYFYLNVILTV